ncbi:relaxase domain-containing protein [Nodosilinea sp. LEGE 06152]|uniref:MobF family relaxase n=1 Tax=Nodosilinea sp. LEGE 06152 TaxID=2777966 RepID=UPI001882AFF1|nr:MobF family relaxase [Nodosilinea sp. LEGE 06152]MBE9155988.1 relaxase domain-containing protein [Nodosilinea sp. LEGE 06152]
MRQCFVMLSIAKMGRKSKYYYVNLAQSSYEASSALPGEPPAVWGGDGARQLGLYGAVNRAEFFLLFDGFSPDEETKLVENAGGKRRVPGWDLVFTPPKSVSILWVVVDPALRAAIERLHHRAVEAAIAYLESRARLLTHDAPPAGLVVAYFEHGSNRAGEPNLHTHALVLNDGVAHNGATGPINSRVLYQHKMAAGAIYRSELAALLQAELGLELVRCQSWFELTGFSRTEGRYQTLMNLWSSRRKAIEAMAPSTAAQAQAVAYMTREKKGYVPPRDELLQMWQEVTVQHGLSQRRAMRFIVPEGKKQMTLWQRFQEWRTLREARKIVVMHQSHFSRRDLVTAIAVAAQARGLNSVDVLRLTDTCLKHRQVMSIGVVKDEERFTFKRLYRLEQSLLSQATKLAVTPGMRVSHRQVERAGTGERLSVEQRRALHTLTEGGKLKVLSGISGTGKTHTLIAAAKAYRNSGYTVVAVSPSRQGAEHVKESGLESQGVLSKLLYGEVARSITVYKLFYVIDRAKEGKRRYGSRAYAKDPLSRKTVVIVDEAQALSAAQMLRLLKEVSRAGGKLIISGDIKAPQAFEHSGAFKALAQKISSATATLTEIKRQDPSLSQNLVQGIGTGKVATVANLLRDETIFHLSETRDEAQAKLIADWLTQATASPKDNLIIVDTKEEAADLNTMAQAALRKVGVLSNTAIKTKASYFRVGDRVMFHETSPTYGVTKGNTGTIERVELLTKVAVIRLDSGKTRLLNLRHYKSLTLAYALTPSEAKHKEVRRSFVLTQGRGQDVSLVQVSRAKGSTQIYSYAPQRIDEPNAPEWELGRKMVYQKENELSIIAEKEARKESLGQGQR